MATRVFALTLIALVGLGVRPEAQTSVPVFVSWYGQDAIGRQLAFELREQIRKSKGYRIVEREPDALVRVSIVSTTTPSAASSVAIAYTLWPGVQDRFVTVAAIFLREREIPSEARSIAGVVDDIASQLRQMQQK